MHNSDMGIVRTREIQPSKKEAEQIWKSIRKANRQCKVPRLPGEPPESNALTNCHIIGESILKVIAQKSHVYEWQNDPMLLWYSAVNEIKAGNVTELPWDVGKAVLFRDQGFSIDKCGWRFACNHHDNTAFKLIDTLDMDLTSRKVQFLLGFRAIAATTAWSESYLQLFKVFPKRRRIQKIISEYQQARLAVPHLKQQINRMEIVTGIVAKELSRWQDIYSAQAVEDYPIMTCRRTAEPVIRSAGAGVPLSNGRSIIATTILPRRQDGRAKTLCDIVVTCLRPKSWIRRLYLSWRIKRQASKIAKLLSKDPVDNIPVLAHNLNFFYVSPDDFDNDTILNDKQRQEIHARIARLRTPSQS